MKQIQRLCEVRHGKKYVTTYIETDTATVYASLTADLINKKLCNCSYIRRIVRNSNYDGTQDIIVYYDNGVRNTYTVKN